MIYRMNTALVALYHTILGGFLYALGRLTLVLGHEM